MPNQLSTKLTFLMVSNYLPISKIDIYILRPETLCYGLQVTGLHTSKLNITRISRDRLGHGITTLVIFLWACTLSQASRSRIRSYEVLSLLYFTTTPSYHIMLSFTHYQPSLFSTAKAESYIPQLIRINNLDWPKVA